MVFASRVIIPDQSIRGDIARIAKYMNLTYGVTYSKRQLVLFEKWEKRDPVSEEELQLINRIQRVQKTGVFDVWIK
ncbi:hypothetical protein AVO41_09135 [Thiomicrospira sp. WB1]|nr:hypothetical protein AVO41_09135 [Thiomicrospira sp. WB1]